jgi:hypothetical protein
VLRPSREVAIVNMPVRRQLLCTGIGQRDALPAHRRQRNCHNADKPLPHLISPRTDYCPKRMNDPELLRSGSMHSTRSAAASDRRLSQQEPSHAVSRKKTRPSGLDQIVA